MYLYDVGDHDGDPADRLLTSDGDRCYTTLKVKVVALSIEGLAGFQAQVLDEGKTSILKTENMEQYSTGSNIFLATLNVDGFATGSYWVRIQGIPNTHIVSYEITNPDWTSAQVYLRESDEASLMELVKAGAYGGKWPIPQTEAVSEVKDDVDILEPPDKKVFIQNPWRDLGINFDLTQASPSSPVTFSYEVFEGVPDGVILAILNSQNSKIASSQDPNNFTFNQGGAQADGSYTAILYVVGAPGWIGGSPSIDFYIDNPEDIDGIVRILVLQDGEYVEVAEGGILKGTVIIEAEITSGNASACNLMISGPQNQTIEMNYAGVNLWSISLNTRHLVNGDYDLSVEVERASDGAKMYLSVLSAGVFDGVESITIETPLDLTMAYGAVVLLVIFYVYYRWKQR